MYKQLLWSLFYFGLCLIIFGVIDEIKNIHNSSLLEAVIAAFIIAFSIGYLTGNE